MAATLSSTLAVLAAALAVAAFGFRDVAWIRGLAVLAALAAVLAFVTSQPVPWALLAAALAVAAVNLWMLLSGVRSEKSFTLTAEEMMLYARLPGVTPSQFRALLTLAAWQNPEKPLPLTTEGQMPEALHYILEGQVKVTKAGKTFSVGPHAFIGELSFLRNKPATATTAADAGALVVSWNQEKLRTLLKSNDGLKRAIDSLLTADMAEKIARTGPPLLQEQKG